jgi:hypothetical protein
MMLHGVPPSAVCVSPQVAPLRYIATEIVVTPPRGRVLDSRLRYFQHVTYVITLTALAEFSYQLPICASSLVACVPPGYTKLSLSYLHW